MNLTVSLGTTQQRLHPTMRNQETVIGIVQLQQPPDGSLFVIGDIRAKMQMGLALFSNMALQPVTPPISNREYEFRCDEEFFIFIPSLSAAFLSPPLQQRVCGSELQVANVLQPAQSMLSLDLHTANPEECCLTAWHVQVCACLGCRQRPPATSEACVCCGQAPALHTGHAHDGEPRGCCQHCPHLALTALLPLIASHRPERLAVN
jgi:hypothetical protein